MEKIKIIYIAAFAFGVCLFASCKKQSLLTYDVPDNIYFNYKVSSGVITDSATFSFASKVESVQDSIFKLPLAVTGVANDHDRTYQVIVVDSNTTAIAGQHFVLPATFTFHAGRILDSLPVKFLRSPDLKSKVTVLKLALLPTDDLKTGIKYLFSSIGGTINALTFKFNISDMLVAGNYWTSLFAAYFGDFSVKKIKLIHDITGMPLDFYTTGWLSDHNAATNSQIYAITMKNYLSDQKKAGHTIYEEDGITEMKMGLLYQ